MTAQQSQENMENAVRLIVDALEALDEDETEQTRKANGEMVSIVVKEVSGSLGKLGLGLACSSSVTIERARVLVLLCFEVKEEKLIRFFLEGLSIARRFTYLDALALPICQMILSENNEFLASDKKAVFDKLLFGSIHSPELVAEILPDLFRLSESNPFWQRYLIILSQAHLPYASAARRKVESGYDRPAQNLLEVESELRENSWIRNAATKLPFLVSQNSLKQFDFTYPYFPWPEGRWKLEPQAGQGNHPEFTLTASMEGECFASVGALTSLPDPQSTLNSLQCLQGTCLSPIERYADSLSYEIFFGSLSDMDPSWLSSTTPISVRNRSPIQFVVDAEQIVGWHGQGPERIPILGIPRRVAPSGATFSFGGGLSREGGQLETLKLQHGQSLAFNQPFSFPFNSGWAMQCWILSQEKDTWSVVAIFDPFFLIWRHSSAGSAELALYLRSQPQLSSESKSAESYTFLAQNVIPMTDTQWTHLAWTGSPEFSISVYVNGMLIFDQVRTPNEYTSVYRVSFGGDLPDALSLVECSTKPCFSFIKVWDRLLTDNSVKMEFENGFSLDLSGSNNQLSGCKPWAFYTLHGPPSVALFEVGGSLRHLQVISAYSFAPLQSQRIGSSSAKAQAVFLEDLQMEMMVFGPCSSTSPNLELQKGSSVWGQHRFPVQGGLKLAVETVCTSSAGQATLLLHGGSFWDLARCCLAPFQDFTNQLRIHVKTRELSPTNFGLEVCVEGPGTRPFCLAPTIGYFSNMTSSGVLSLELEYDPKLQRLEFYAFNQSLLSIDLNLETLFGLAGPDGLFVGVMCTGPLTRVTMLKAYGTSIDSASTGSNDPSLVSDEILKRGSIVQTMDDHSNPLDFGVPGGHFDQMLSHMDEWTCNRCSHKNATSLIECGSCGSSNMMNQYNCPSCTFLNPINATTCETCFRKLSSNSSTMLGNDGSRWACKFCTFENEPNKEKCVSCDIPRFASDVPPVGPLSIQDLTDSSIGLPADSNVTSSSWKKWEMSENDKALLQEVIDARVANLKRCLHEVQNPSISMERINEMDLTTDEDGFIAVGATHQRRVLSHIWDTTSGLLHIRRSETSSQEPSCPTFAMVLQGMYGQNDGQMEVMARLSSDFQWNLTGTWTTYRLTEDADSKRIGTHLIDLQLDKAGEKLSGKWSSGESGSGDFRATLMSDCSQFRGLTRVFPARPAVLSLQDLLALDEAQSSTRPIDDQLTTFQPMRTGLSNMQQGLTNVCYQNSLLQALFATEDFRYAMLFPPPTTTGTNVPLFSSLQKLFGNLLLTHRSAIDSRILQDDLDMIWRTGHQMDVADFHDYLMGQLMEAFPDGQLGALFGCATTQINKCISCSKVKAREEQALGISVSLPRQYLPITNIMAVSCPSMSEMSQIQLDDGFEMLRTNLNKDKSDSPCIFLCVKRDPKEKPITSLIVKFLPGSDPAPTQSPGHHLVPLNLNSGPIGNSNPDTTPDQIYLSYQRDDSGSPITEIKLLVGEQDINAPPEGFRVISTNLNPSWSAREVLVPSGSTNVINLTNINSTAHGPNSTSSSSTVVNGKRSIPAGPATTPVNLCYRRGMPITDVKVSESSPQHARAEYQVIDIPINSALNDKGSNDLFIWVTESNAFESPVTDLILVHESDLEKYFDTGYEMCGSQVFVGRRFLMQKRGNGCPLTHIDVFQSPRPAPLFRFHRIMNARQSEDVVFEDRIVDTIGEHSWTVSVVDSGSNGQNQGTTSSTTDGSSSLFGQPSGDTVPSDLVAAKGTNLQIEVKMPNVPGMFVHGNYSGLDSAYLGNGKIAGILFKSPNSDKWDFFGSCNPDQNNGHSHSIQFSLLDGKMDGVIMASSPNTTNSILSTKPEPLKFQAKRASSLLNAHGPIDDVIVLRQGDAVPPGYSIVKPPTDIVEGVSDIMRGSGLHSTFIAFRRCMNALDAELDPIVQIGLVIPIIETNIDDWEVLTSFNGQDGNLATDSNSLPVYLCVKRRSKASTQTNFLQDLVLQWKSQGQPVPQGFSVLSETVLGIAPAQLGIPDQGPFLCAKYGPSVARACPHPLNGVYKVENPQRSPLHPFRGDHAQIKTGMIEIFAVSGERSGIVVDGTVESARTLYQPSSRLETSSISGVLLPLDIAEEAAAFIPSVPMLSKKCSRRKWLFCGIWGLRSASRGSKVPCVPTMWRISRGEVTTEIEAFWSCGGKSGVVHCVQNDFLQIAYTIDSTEMWAESVQIFSDRSSDVSVQSLIRGSFSSTVLTGNDSLMCDNEGEKTVHLQHTVLTSPPNILVLTVKCMGFDHKRNRPIKHLETTRFEPILRLPSPNERLLDQVEQQLGDSKLHDNCAKSISTEDPAYGLYAVIVHTGPNANSGHYFVYTRRSTDANLHMEDSPTAPWTLFNDSTVQSMTWKSMQDQIGLSESNSAYVLLYRRLGSEDSFMVSSPEELLGDDDLLENKRRCAEVSLPSKKARTGEQGVRSQEVLLEYSEDMEEEEALAAALRLSQSHHTGDSEPSEETTFAEASHVSLPLKVLEDQKAILNRVRNHKFMTPWLKDIIQRNKDFLLNGFENQTSYVYREFLSALAKQD